MSSNFDSSSLAGGVFASVDNEALVPGAQVLPRKIFIVGTFDPAKTAIVPDVPVRVFSAEEVGFKTGFGFMLHRLAKRVFAISGGIETWIIPQDEAGGSVKAAGTVTFTASSVSAGTVNFYVGGEKISFTIAKDDTAAEVNTKFIAAVNAALEAPITALVDGVVPEQADVTVKTAGAEWGNNCKIGFNIATGESFPDGLSAVVVQPTGGVGTPDISTALDSLGVDDDANLDNFTDGVHGYGLNTDVLDAIEAYVGSGDEKVGLYSPTVARPFRVMTGDIGAGSSGLSDIITLADDRTEDRANGVICAPGEPYHPSELAALAIGYMAKINNNRAEENYNDASLGIESFASTADRWTSSYTNRDTAVKSGVGTTKKEAGTNVLVLQDVITFYRPASVPVASNGYRRMRDISLLQNILYNELLTFKQDKWKGVTIVADKSNVGNATSKEKARDLNDVRDELISLFEQFVSNAWVFSMEKVIESLSAPGAVSIRAGGNGFNSNVDFFLSGSAAIISVQNVFDTNIGS